MSLKALNQFQKFDIDEFLKEKQLVFVKAEDLFEYVDDSAGNRTRKVIGSKVIVDIVSDNTTYRTDGITNLHERLEVKVPNIAVASYEKFVFNQTPVAISDVEKAVIWGDNRNNLSITAKVVALKSK
ncbi:MAG: hypothetical protein QM632_02870 [Micrococcaceae bacterium]